MINIKQVPQKSIAKNLAHLFSATVISASLFAQPAYSETSSKLSKGEGTQPSSQEKYKPGTDTGLVYRCTVFTKDEPGKYYKQLFADNVQAIIGKRVALYDDEKLHLSFYTATVSDADTKEDLYAESMIMASDYSDASNPYVVSTAADLGQKLQLNLWSKKVLIHCAPNK